MYGESIDGSCKNYISVAPIGLERVPTKHKVVGSNPTRDTSFNARVVQRLEQTTDNRQMKVQFFLRVPINV